MKVDIVAVAKIVIVGCVTKVGCTTKKIIDL